MTHIKFIEINLIFFEFRGQRSNTTKTDNAAKDELTVEWFGEVHPFCKQREIQIFEDSGDSVSPFKRFDDVINTLVKESNIILPGLDRRNGVRNASVPDWRLEISQGL